MPFPHKIMVSGPGQNASASLYASSGMSRHTVSAIPIPSTSTLSGLASGRPFAS